METGRFRTTAVVGSNDRRGNSSSIQLRTRLPDVYAVIPRKEDFLVHQPFFWNQLVAVADVKIGNWAKASKGFAKVDDRSSLWRDVASWQAKARASPQGQTRATIVFAKCSLCTLLSADRSYVPGPYVLLGTFNDNWGILSDNRPNIHFKQSLQMTLDPRCGRTMSDLEQFLADPRLKLWFVNHHVFRRGGLHRKVLSLPLGVQDRGVWDVGSRLAQEASAETVRTATTEGGAAAAAAAGAFTAVTSTRRLLEVNNNEWRSRKALNEAVNASFGHTLVNSYHSGYKEKTATLTAAQRRQIQAAYLKRLSESDFVLCPPGLGMDSYRVYEVLAMGSVPVVERSAGLDRALANLPVLFLQDLAADLTPALLQHVKQLKRFRWTAAAAAATTTTAGRLGEEGLRGDRTGRGQQHQQHQQQEKEDVANLAPLPFSRAESVRGLRSSPSLGASWEYERLTWKFWAERVRAGAVAGEVPDYWGQEQEDESSQCRCWFPAGTCVEFGPCNGGIAP